MSSTLTIEPIYRSKTELSCELKFALRRGRPDRTEHYLSDTDIPFFEGLLASGIEDAAVVISMIEKHGDCLIKEEY